MLRGPTMMNSSLQFLFEVFFFISFLLWRELTPYLSPLKMYVLGEEVSEHWMEEEISTMWHGETVATTP